MKFVATSLVAIALSGCALTKPPLVTDATPAEARLLAENRAAAQKVSTVSSQQKPTAARTTLDVDRINRKLTDTGETRVPVSCPERDTVAYAEIHATWGDTAQDLQQRRACASRRSQSQ